jgi:hypothetical protein
VPSRSNPGRPFGPTALLLAFAILASILWLLPLFSPHSVLFPGGPNYADILVYKGRFTVYHSLKFFTSRAFSGFAYPPGAAPIYEFFYQTSNALATYLTLATITALAALTAAWLYLRRNGIARLFPLLLLFSFPLVFLIQRANIEIVLWIVVALGIVAYRRSTPLPAGVLFGLAASVKLYPIFLLGLFLKRRSQLPAFFVGLTTAILALIAATAYTGPTFLQAASGFTTGLGRFQDHYVETVSSVELIFDHSLFAPLKYQAYLQHISPAPWTHIYYLIAGTFALLLFLRVRTLPAINRIVFLVAAMVSLPPVSFTYTLVHLYLPLLLLLGLIAASRTVPPPTAIVVLALLLFLLLPLMAVQALHNGTPPWPTGPMQSCALLAILVLTALTPWHGPSAPQRT